MLNRLTPTWAPMWALALLLSLHCGLSAAHTPGESYLLLNEFGGRLQGELQVRSEDLAHATALEGLIGRDSDQAQVEAAGDRLLAYLQQQLQLSADGRPLPLQWQPPQVEAIDDLGNYVVTRFTVPASERVPTYIDLRYALLMDELPEHRGLVVVRYSDHSGHTNFANAIAASFDSGQRQTRVDLSEGHPWQNFVEFVISGTEHILFGLDHVLFVLALLVQAVVVRRDGQWIPVANVREGFIKLVKVVTLFTIAHSITLSLAVLGLVSLPSRLVESVIAASIAIVALNILVPVFKERIGWMVFIFGLFHGLGFAGNLEYLGLADGSLLVPLAGFNVGVELGQLAIVALVFPLLYLLSRRDFYTPMVLKPGSGLIAIAALLWLTERVFDVDGLIPG